MKNFVIVLLIAIIVGLPFLLRPEQEISGDAEYTLVVVSPHNEAIRSEFEHGFQKWYAERTGRAVAFDWRTIGGTSEIVRFVNSTYMNRFRNYWEEELGREWNLEVQDGFANPRLELDDTPEDDTVAEAARRAFLGSDVGIGIDLFFGGGSYDFGRQAQMGQLVPWIEPSELETRFTDDVIPQNFAGEPFWDPEGRWMGVVLSTFGIIYNVDAYAALGLEAAPENWEDLADPRLAGRVALADPTKSGSSTKAFEMIVQERMQRIVATLEAGGADRERAEARGVPLGWMDGMRLIQRIAANARYFTDAATKPVIDVSMGDCAAGMAIDFYGRFQEENITRRSGRARMAYVAPKGGSTVSADPVGLFRGAPNEEIAKAFIEFCSTLPGQRLWSQKVGTEGGPVEYALRRSAALKAVYREENLPNLSDPEVNPYEDVGGFAYQSAWTGRLFSPLRFIIKVSFIDTHDELREARKAIERAREEGREADAESAEQLFDDLELIRYEAALERIAPVLRTGDKIEEIRLAKEISDAFRSRYRRVAEIASGRAG